MDVKAIEVRGLSLGEMPSEATANDQTSFFFEERLKRSVLAAAADNQRVYEKILRDCETLIRKSVRRMGLAETIVDDVVQECLVTLHKVLQTYDPDRSFMAWLHVIARHRAIDEIRRIRRHRDKEVFSSAEYMSHVDDRVDLSGALQAADDIRWFKRQVASLPNRQRDAVERLALRGQSLAEASQETGRSTGSLKCNYHRALKSLRLKKTNRDLRQ